MNPRGRSRRDVLRASAVALGVTSAGCTVPAGDEAGTLTFEGVGDEFQNRVETVYERVSDLVQASIEERTTITVIDTAEMRERAGTFQVVGGSTTQKLAHRALGLMETLDAELPFEFAGAYYPGSATIRLVGADERDVDDQLLAHELFHAIQFQTAGVAEWNRSWSIGFDRYNAQQALVEGAAMVVEDEYVGGCGGDFARCQLSEPTRVDPTAIDPALLLSYGSYFNGHDFVDALTARGGWEAAWRAHDDPPIATSQILRPEWYPDRRPESVPGPEDPGGSWAILDTERLGMQALFVTLWHEGALPDDAVYTRGDSATDEVYTSLVRYRSAVSDAWRGDAFTGFERTDGHYGWLWRIRFSDTGAAETGFEHVRSWAETRGARTDVDDVWDNDGRYEALALDGEDVLVGMAPEPDDFAAFAPELRA